MLGRTGPDAFPEFDGWQPTARRSEIAGFTEDDAAALLDGDGSGHGHHRFGSGVKSDEFPDGWSERDVIEWIRAIIDSPADGLPESDDHFSLLGSHRGVVGVLRIQQTHNRGWIIATGHPYDRIRWSRDHD